MGKISNKLKVIEAQQALENFKHSGLSEEEKETECDRIKKVLRMCEERVKKDNADSERAVSVR